MKVTGLARRRPKRKRGGLVETTLRVIGMEELAPAMPNPIEAGGQEQPAKACFTPKAVGDSESAVGSDQSPYNERATDLSPAIPPTPCNMPIALNMRHCAFDEGDRYSMSWVYDYCMKSFPSLTAVMSQPIILTRLALQVMLSIRLCGNKEAMAAWSGAFLHDPLIFHASHWCASIHRSLRSRTDRWTKCSTALVHKAEAMSLLRQRLEQLDRTDVDWLIYAVLCLTRAETQKQDHASLESSLLFVPHVPSANWTNVYGRSGLVEAHRDALCQLVKRQGGLRRLKVPGLSYGLAL